MKRTVLPELPNKNIYIVSFIICFLLNTIFLCSIAVLTFVMFTYIVHYVKILVWQVSRKNGFIKKSDFSNILA